MSDLTPEERRAAAKARMLAATKEHDVTGEVTVVVENVQKVVKKPSLLVELVKLDKPDVFFTSEIPGRCATWWIHGAKLCGYVWVARFRFGKERRSTYARIQAGLSRREVADAALARFRALGGHFESRGRGRPVKNVEDVACEEGFQAHGGIL